MIQNAINFYEKLKIEMVDFVKDDFAYICDFLQFVYLDLWNF